MTLSSPQQRRRVFATPRGGPVGSEVEVKAVELPPMIEIQIGFGNLQQHSIVAQTATDGDGNVVVKVTIPEFAERDKLHFFFVAFDDATPRGISDPFHVTGPDGTARVRGQLTDEGKACRVLRTAMDDVYTLIGDTSAFKAGTTVTLRGKIADGAPCGGQGITVAVDEIRAAL